MPVLSLMPHQKEIVLATESNCGVFAGRGAGKTDAIQARLKYRSSKYAGLRSSYVTPYSWQSNEVFEVLSSDPDFRKFISRVEKRPFPKIFCKNKSRIFFRSFQRPDSMRSSGEDELYPDESQDPCYTERNYDNIIRPLVGRRQSPAGGRGIIMLSGQFRGEDWRYKRFYLPGQQYLENGDINRLYNPLKHRSWRIPSSAGYAYNTPGGPELLAEIKATTPTSAWEQEWDCLPRANQNAVYRASMVDDVSIKRETPVECWNLDKPWDRGPTITAVDVAEIVDHTAVSVTDSRGHIVYTEQFKQRQDGIVSANRAAQIALHFHSEKMIVDCTGGGRPGQSSEKMTELIKMFRDAAHERGIDFEAFYFSNQKRTLVVDLEIALQQKRIGIPARGCEILLSEMKAYEYQYNDKTKWYTYSAPKGQHDDVLTSCLMAWYGFKKYLEHRGQAHKGLI